MISQIKKLAFKAVASRLPKGVKSIILKEYGIEPLCHISYAQEGEDLLLDLIFSYKKTGFYIDIGAHHPVRFSNTYRFYKKGWKGINIDASPGFYDLFQAARERDINIECAITDINGEQDFFIFDEPALNTLSTEEANKYINEGKYKLLEKIRLKTRTINDVLNQHIPENKKIDFISIDIEGVDRKVILNLDFDRFKPEIILFEDLYSLTVQNDINDHLEKNGYTFIAKTLRTVFYRRNTK